MSAQHTSGPWNVKPALGLGDRVVSLDVEPEMTDYRYRGSICRISDAEHIDGISKDERDANARLIAAAPDLLEALRDMVSDRAELSPATLQFARAAIAKATGAAS